MHWADSTLQELLSKGFPKTWQGLLKFNQTENNIKLINIIKQGVLKINKKKKQYNIN